MEPISTVSLSPRPPAAITISPASLWVAALMISRKADLTPADLRAALTHSARDLGAVGRDDEFGAGEADAFAAVSAIGAPVETAAGKPGTP